MFIVTRPPPIQPRIRWVFDHNPLNRSRFSTTSSATAAYTINFNITAILKIKRTTTTTDLLIITILFRVDLGHLVD